MRKFVALLFLPSILTGCVRHGDFSSLLVDLPNGTMIAEEVHLEGGVVRVKFKFLNTTENDVCFRKYENVRTDQNSYVVVSQEFYPPAPLSAGLPLQYPYTEGLLHPGDVGEFVAFGEYAGSKSDLIERGQFLIIFMNVSCENREVMTRIRSDVFSFAALQVPGTPSSRDAILNQLQ